MTEATVSVLVRGACWHSGAAMWGGCWHCWPDWRQLCDTDFAKLLVSLPFYCVSTEKVFTTLHVNWVVNINNKISLTNRQRPHHNRLSLWRITSIWSSSPSRRTSRPPRIAISATGSLRMLRRVPFEALVHFFLKSLENSSILHETTEILQIWYRSCLAPLPLFGASSIYSDQIRPTHEYDELQEVLYMTVFSIQP